MSCRSSAPPSCRSWAGWCCGRGPRPGLFRYALRSGKAVHDPSVLTAELLDGYIAANLADTRRRAKTRRFLAGQLDPANHRATAGTLAGLRAFDHPTLIVWGEDDPHFGPEWAGGCARTSPARGAWSCYRTPGTC